MILLTTQFFFIRLLKRTINLYTQRYLISQYTSFRPKMNYLFAQKSVYDGSLVPVSSGFFFSFFFLLYNEHCPQIDVNRENQYIKQY